MEQENYADNLWEKLPRRLRSTLQDNLETDETNTILQDLPEDVYSFYKTAVSDSTSILSRLSLTKIIQSLQLPQLDYVRVINLHIKHMSNLLTYDVIKKTLDDMWQEMAINFRSKVFNGIKDHYILAKIAKPQIKCLINHTADDYMDSKYTLTDVLTDIITDESDLLELYLAYIQHIERIVY
jgi:hypothetical protein